MTLPIAILAGGLATRLGTLTAITPKSLIDIDGQPFAAHQIALLKRRGVTDIVLLVGHLGTTIQHALGDGGRYGVHLRYAFDGPRPLGTGGAIRHALPQLGDRFMVLYGDSYLDCDYRAVELAFAASGKPALMTVLRNDDRWDRSNVVFADGRIASYDKNTPRGIAHHIDYGLGAFTSAPFARHPPDQPFDLSTVYGDLLAAADLAGFEVHDRFYEIGSAAGLADTRRHLTGEGRTTP